MAGLRSSDETYKDDMEVFLKIVEATGDSLETVCRMQEEERNNLIKVLGLQREEETLVKTGNKRKALQTFQSEMSKKRFVSGNREVRTEDRTETRIGGNDEDDLKIENTSKHSGRSSRAAAQKATLKVSEMLKTSSGPESRNDPDQLIEDFDDFDEEKGEVSTTKVSDQDESDHLRGETKQSLNLSFKFPGLMKFVRKPLDILKGDLPELKLEDPSSRQLKSWSLEDGTKHYELVKSLTREGLTHRQISKKSWVNIKISRNLSKQKSLAIRDKLGTGEEEKPENSEGLNDEEKRDNDEDEVAPDRPLKNEPRVTLKSFRKKSQIVPSKLRENGFDFIGGNGENDFEAVKDSQKSLFDKIKQSKKINNAATTNNPSIGDENSSKSDDEIQFVKEVKSPHVLSVQPLAKRERDTRKIQNFFDEDEDDSIPSSSKSNMVDCPLCNSSFTAQEVEDHAATCEGSY